MRLKFKWIYTLLLALSMQFSFAQEKTVSGVVSDGTGPVPGANVVVKGTKNGVQADFDGKYAIKAKVGDVLVVSFVGMQDVSAKVGATNTINFKLQAGNALNEVVVVGYGQVKKRNEVTGNVSTVNADKIKAAPMVSVDQALQGNVAGLQMSTTSGTPGSSQDIRIRGRNSINAGNDPLFVIDGVPMINSNFSGSTNISSLSTLSSIAADNIESMTVLKDAGATSVYGARGANGVILITTKKGKKGDAQFSLSSSVGFQNNAVDGLRPLTGAEKTDLYLESIFNTYGATYNFTKAGALAWATTNLAANTSAMRAWIAAGRKEYDWTKLMKNEDALMNNLDFSVSAGDDKSTLYASVGYNKTEATVIGSDFKRVTANLNYTRKLTDKWDLKTGVNVSNVKQAGVLEQAAYFSNPNLTRYFMSPWNSPYNADGTYFLPTTGLHNSLYTAANNIRANELTRLMSNNSVSYKISKDLIYNGSISLDYTMNSYKGFNDAIHGDGVAYGGTSSASVSRNFNYVAQNSIDYRLAIGENHKLDFKGLLEYQKNKLNFISAYGEVLPLGFTNVANAAANKDASSTFDDWSNLSYLGILNYKFQDRFLLDLTLRREGSSRFSEATRWGNFYSAGAAWNIDNENFMKKVSFVDLLRLRGSYGSTGNNAIGLNEFQTLLGTSSYNNQGGMFPSQFGTTGLTWEIQNKLDTGIEFGLFNSRIKGSVAYFDNKSEDLLLSLPMSLTTGHTSQTQNLGKLRNSGLEFELDLDIIRSDNFNWSIGGNYSTVKNEVTDMPIVNGTQITITGGTTRTEVGHPVSGWYMRKYAGVDPANGNALWYVNGVDGATTTNYSAATQTWQGDSALPKYSGGFNTHVDLNNFYFDATLYIAGGHKIYEDWATYTQNSGRTSLLSYNGSEPLLSRWQKPGDITNVPKLEYTQTAGNSTAHSTSTRFLHDGDYMRLRDVTIGYNFKSAILSQFSLDGLSFSLRGTNLMTWVKDKDLKYDPEVRADGFTRLTSPPVKSVVFSINVKF